MSFSGEEFLLKIIDIAAKFTFKRKLYFGEKIGGGIFFYSFIP